MSLGCSSKLIHLEVHDEPLVSFYRELTLCPEYERRVNADLTRQPAVKGRKGPFYHSRLAI